MKSSLQVRWVESTGPLGRGGWRGSLPGWLCEHQPLADAPTTQGTEGPGIVDDLS